MPKHKHTFSVVGRSGGVTLSASMVFIGTPERSKITEKARAILGKEFSKIGIEHFEIRIRKWIRGRGKKELSNELVRARRCAKAWADKVAMIEAELEQRFLQKRGGIRGTGH